VFDVAVGTAVPSLTQGFWPSAWPSRSQDCTTGRTRYLTRRWHAGARVAGDSAWAWTWPGLRRPAESGQCSIQGHLGGGTRSALWHWV